MQDKITIADAPECLNTNDKAMWVLGYEAAIEARSTCLHQIQEPEDDIWPCVNIDVDDDGNITNAKFYAPGFPPGNHDVYPVRVPYMDEHTEAWRACVDELEKHVPGFMCLSNMNGIECAVAAIRLLSERAKNQEPSAAEQAAWHAGLDEGRTQAAPAAVAVLDDRAAFERELIDNHHYVPSDFSFKDGFYGGDDDYIQFGWDVWKARAALAATPAAVEAPATERMMQLVDAWFSQMKSGNVISQGMARQRIVMFVDTLAATPAATVLPYSRETFRVGGRCEQHLCPKPCEQCSTPAAAATSQGPVTWMPGPNEFKDWCAQWFGPDSDDSYLAKAVYDLPPMAQRFQRHDSQAAVAPVVLPEPIGVMSATTPRTVAWNCTFMPEAGTHLYTEQQVRALLAGVSAPAAQPERKYICPVRTIADLVNNLMLMDQALPIYGAQYIEHPPGKRRAIAVPPTVSIERVKDSRWIGEGEALNTAIVWTRAEQPAAPQAQADARDAEQEKPPAGRYVLAWMEGREIPIRAMWVPKSWLVAGNECQEGWAEYDDGKDEHYCPEGWYEANEHEETHWHVSTPIVAWADLPRRTAIAAQAAQQGGDKQ